MTAITLHLPDDLAARLSALPERERNAFTAAVNDFAVVAIARAAQSLAASDGAALPNGAETEQNPVGEEEETSLQRHASVSELPYTFRRLPPPGFAAAARQAREASGDFRAGGEILATQRRAEEQRRSAALRGQERRSPEEAA